MSVLVCARRYCENIMCDRYSYIHGYICNSCFEELAGKRVAIEDIPEFMNTPKYNEVHLAHIDYNDIFRMVGD